MAKKIDILDSKAWIEAYGSVRLKRMLQEGIDHRGVYLDEWLAKERPGENRKTFLDRWIAYERPGWKWSYSLDAELTPSRNVPLEAFDVLDEARKLEPDAKLWYCRSKGSSWKGDVAVAERFGYDMVFGFEVGEGR